MRRSSRLHPRALTLIELVAVITIVVILAVIGYAMIPRLTGNARRVSSVDRVSQWLLTARQRAKRDGVPTGIRFLPQTDDNGKIIVEEDGSVLIKQLQYVQQPAPLVGGQRGARGWVRGVCQTVVKGRITFSNVDFLGGGSSVDEFLVQPGDYLELQGGGSVHRITTVNSNILGISEPLNLPTFQPTANYKILRQPRPILGETVLDVPGEVALDLGVPSAFDSTTKEPIRFRGSSQPRSLNIPERVIGNPPQLILEVVFTPGGAVLGANNGRVILWLRDSESTNIRSATLLAIPASTGAIGAFEVAPGANPYLYTEDGRSSGL